MVKKSMKKLFVGLAVLSTAGSLCASTDGSTFSTSQGFFQPRPASANIAREMLMEPASKHRNSEGWYGEFSATAFYQRSWNQDSAETSAGDGSINDNLSVSNQGFLGLGAMPFWSGSSTMNIGNAVTGVPASTQPEVDGYQFGLGITTIGDLPANTIGAMGTVNLNPIVYQAGADFMFIVGSSANEPGFYAKIKAPIAVYNINPQLSAVEPTAAATYNQGQLNQTTTGVAVPNSTIVQAFAGTAGDGLATGDFQKMAFGLVNGQQSTGAKFGDIEMTAGYSFISNEDNAVRIALRASAPTGNKATAQYMLEPIVGRGGNWGLGGYADGHVCLWEGNNDNRFTFKFMGDVLHLFATDTVRSYDLLEFGSETANRGGSRYLLVADYNNNVYGSSIQNLINVSSLGSQSSFSVEGDVAAAFNYASNGWSLDLGYEFYGRSAETLTINAGAFDSQRYAVLGHQGPGISGTGTTASNACQPGATMFQATTQTATVVTATTVASVATTVYNATVAANRVALENLDIVNAQQNEYFTSKVFTKVAYEWENLDYVPFLGVIGEFEISNSKNNALPQWAVVLVGGISF